MTGPALDELADLLACPQCGAAALQALPSPALSAAQPLSSGAAGALCCGDCSTTFPDVGGVPWLTAEPQARLSDWRQRFHFMLRDLEQEATRTESALARAAKGSAAADRLQRRATALREQPDLLRGVLAPLQLDRPVTRYETHRALRTRLPPSQDLHSYHANVHRDWVWGDAENAAQLALAQELLGTGRFGDVLIVGAGACRFALDLHEARSEGRTVAADINPLLLLSAAAVLGGRTVQLYEFPIAPRSARDVAVHRSLPGRTPRRPGLRLAFADAAALPFKPESFDTVVTPWLIDIVEQPFASLAARVNAMLREGGSWISFGSLAFRNADPLLEHSTDEVLTILAQQGFEPGTTRDVDTPYMRAPSSRHSRVESVWGFCAVKRRPVASPAQDWPLPDWLADARLPVPALEHFRTQAFVNRVYAFVTALIDGQRGIGDIAAHLVEQRLMRPEEAVPAVRTFLLRLFEESRERGPPGAT
jgi:SAM-dependent methyltransferase/uncharacterized protein YbaR (Trm112 family)